MKAVQQQAATLVHAQQNIFAAHEKVAELVQHLSQVMPAHLSRYFLCNSGSEAVDNAIKIARGVTRRQNIIAFDVSKGRLCCVRQLACHAMHVVGNAERCTCGQQVCTD